MKKIIYCLRCGHFRCVTNSWIKNLNRPGLTITTLQSFSQKFKCTRCSARMVQIKTDYEIIKRKNPINRKRIESILKKPFRKGEKNIFCYTNPLSIDQEEKKPYSILDSALLRMNKSESSPQELPPVSFWRKKPCNICGGDGGVGGVCYNCEGTGWVDET